jgi:hypothetical protein
MKLRIAISLAIGLGLVLGAVISLGPIIQKANAAVGSSVESSAAGSVGQSGSNVGGINRNLFCNTGVVTPICK